VALLEERRELLEVGTRLALSNFIWAGLLGRDVLESENRDRWGFIKYAEIV
jgi:hypothetical protein